MNTDGARNQVTGDRSAATATSVLEKRAPEAWHPGDARLLQNDLERSLKESRAADEAPQGEPTAQSATPTGSLIRRLAKIALGLALVTALGWNPLRAMLTTTSVEALVNARVETIRSPIEGIVQSAPDSDRGWSLSGPAPRLRIVDPTADHARLDDLRRASQSLEGEAMMLKGQSELVKAALGTLDVQIAKFRNGRLNLLEARLAAQTAQRSAAGARSSQAEAAKRRTDALRKTGSSTVAESDRNFYDWVAARSTETAEEKRLDETKVERDAIADGVFLGDSYNDSPSSEQRAVELRLKEGELDARANSVRTQMALLAEQIAEEEARYRERSEAVVNLPSSGRVWEMLTAPGERVGKGQDLMRVLDCSRHLVSANVDENVYNRLEVGGRATFRPARGAAKPYDGVIVNLMGAAAASGNLAIPLAAMRKSPYYVTVAVESMNEGGCAVGRTGTVTFASPDETANATAAGSPGGEDDLASRSALPF